MQIQCVQHQWSRRLFWEIQENRGVERWCHCLRCHVSERCWSPAHDLWLTEWSRLHGYPIDDSLVSSVHTLGYGDNYFIQDDNAPCCKVDIVKEWMAQNGVHTLRQKSWPKAHRWLLGRYQAWLVQENSKERHWIWDNLNQIPTKTSSQCLVGSRTVSMFVVAIPAIMLFFVVL